jgi:hypothetical protein
MKTYLTLLGLSVGIVCGLATPAAAGSQSVDVGVRYHASEPSFETLPMREDYSYRLGYRMGDQGGFWQLALNYTPSVSDPSVDYVLTPEVNIILNDKIWRGGIGVLKSYVEPKDGSIDSDWTDIYWQLFFGVAVPVGGVSLEAFTYYVFEDWGELEIPGMDDLDLGVWVKFKL